MFSFSGPLVFLQCEVSFIMLLSPQSAQDDDDDDDETFPFPCNAVLTMVHQLRSPVMRFASVFTIM